MQYCLRENFLFRYSAIPLFRIPCFTVSQYMLCVHMCTHAYLYVCTDMYTQNLKAAFYMCVCACHIHIFMINTEW